LLEGEYEVVIDEQTVPEGLLLALSAHPRMQASNINSPVPIISVLREKPSEQKPIRRMFQGQVDNLGVWRVAKALARSRRVSPPRESAAFHLKARRRV
jgi:hypothetical protein